MGKLNENYRCKVCGGDLGFDPISQVWKCKFCDSEFTLADMEQEGKTELDEENFEKGKNAEEFGYTQATDDTKVDAKDLKVYKCKYCGAEIITDKNTAATFCVYCNNPIVVEEQLVQGFTPKYVIPFQKTKKQAKEQYLTFIKKPFTPTAFMTEEHLEKIKGVYIPFWLYDATVSGRVQAECEDLKVYRRGNQEITEHDKYQVNKAGEIIFGNIPVDASSKTDNCVMDSIEPFDFKDIKEFEMPYLAGFYAEKYDEDDRLCYPRVKERAISSLKQKLTKEAGKGFDRVHISSEEMRMDKCSAQYALLPVWLLYSTFDNKKYMFAMNGQTGKMIGDIPIDPKKVAGCFGKWFAVSFSFVFLISFIFTLFM